jgi:hypothetical protein
MALFGAPRFEAGTRLKFTYTGPDQEALTRYKEIFVLNPNYQGKVHALDLKRMTPAQIQVIDAIFDPDYQTGKKKHPYALVNDILRRMNPSEDIKNPLSFYQRFVKPFLRTAGDCYRQYWPQHMSGVQIVKKSSMEGKQISPMNGKPLFHK